MPAPTRARVVGIMQGAGFVEGEEVGALGPFSLRAVRGPAGDALLVRAEQASDDDVAQLARAHERLSGPAAPSVVSEGPGFVVLDTAPLCTLEGLLGRMARGSVPYSEGIVLSETLALALAEAHSVGVTLGAVSASSVVVTRAGGLAVIGFGAHQRLVDGAFAHPTVAAGLAPTPSTDVYAALMLVRSLVPFVAGLPAQLATLLGGDGGGRFSRGLLSALTVSGGLDGARSLATLRAFWRTLGVEPDRAGLASRLLAAGARRRASRLTLGPGATWFSVDDGPRVSLAQKRAQRAILAALVAAHARGERLPVDALVAAGWPGETMRGTSGRDRLYTAIATLRGAGLRDVLERTHDGYGVARAVHVVPSAR